MGYRKLAARPKLYAQAPQAVEDFKKLSHRTGKDCERGGSKKRIEIWCQDGARISQKNKITRRCAKRGSRPSAPNEQ
jgi:hypothetical protein